MPQMAFVFRTADVGPDFVAISRERMAAAGAVPLVLEAHSHPISLVAALGLVPLFGYSSLWVRPAEWPSGRVRHRCAL